MSKGIHTEQGKSIEVNLEALLATDPALAPKVLEEIDQTTNYILWNKVRYEISLRANLIGEKMKIDVDGLLRTLMESEGQALTQRSASASAFGMVDWGYFYDPQLIDSSTAIILEGEQQPGDAEVDTDSVAGGPSLSRSHSFRHLPAHPGESSTFVKPPVLTETRKLVDAYLKQVAPALDNAADHEQWGGKVKGKK